MLKEINVRLFFLKIYIFLKIVLATAKLVLRKSRILCLENISKSMSYSAKADASLKWLLIFKIYVQIYKLHRMLLAL